MFSFITGLFGVAQSPSNNNQTGQIDSDDSHIDMNRESNTEKRLNNVLDKLLKNNEFKELWERVNDNLHEPIDLEASPPKGEKGYVPKAMFKNQLCPAECSQRNHRLYPHSFKIIVNLDADELDISSRIIFETCNASLWPEHKENTKQVMRNIYDQHEFAVERERVEWQALKIAKVFGDRINKKFFEHIPQSHLDNFEEYLQHQKDTGHFGIHEKKFIDIKKASPDLPRHRKTSSLENHPFGTPASRKSSRRKSTELVPAA